MASNYEITFASVKAPYHAHKIATKYSTHYFRIDKLDNYVKKKVIKKNRSFLYLVGIYANSRYHSADDVVPMYNRIISGHKKTIITFAGSDILQLQNMNKRKQNEFLNILKRKDVIPAAVGDILAGEAKEWFDLDTEVIYLPMNHDFSEEIFPMPKKFTVGCYMPRAGADFYGYDVIMKVIKKMPDINFHFYSLIGYEPNKEEKAIKNLICHEKPVESNEMEDFLKGISCGLRITDHDGNPMSLAEYNAAGRWFVYNRPMPFTELAEERTPESIAEAIRRVQKKATQPNSGSEFYRKRHDKVEFWKRINELYRTK